MTIEAMKQALEALEYIHTETSVDEDELIHLAIAALRAAIEQAQEPVAWMHPSWIDPDTRGWESDSFNAIPIEGWVPVYTAPVDAVNIKLKHVDETAKRAHELGELKEKNNG